MPNYVTTRDRVETYFDRTATKAWERLTSDAPVSRIRQTVREGRTSMRALMLSRLPGDLTGSRVLDAGCGTGAMTEELAKRGPTVVAADISPRLVAIAQDRLPVALRPQVTFHAGDMTDAALGVFDAVLAMDSLISYGADDIALTLHALGQRADRVVFTVAPRTPLLMAMWHAGKLFPRSDRSPVMIPHGLRDLTRATGPGLARVGRVARGLNRPGFTGGQNSRRVARYGTDIKEEDLEAVFTRVPRARGAFGDGTPRWISERSCGADGDRG